MDTVADVNQLQNGVRGLIDRGLSVSSQSLPLSEAQSLDHVVYLLNEVRAPGESKCPQGPDLNHCHKAPHVMF